MTTFAACAHAQGATTDYKGKTVTIVVGVPPGGSYDYYGRLLGRYLGRHLPGEPTIIVSNMPGASSNIAAAYVARSAPKDGTFIAAVTANLPLEPILEDAAVLNYDPSRLNYLGSAVSEDSLCVARPDAPATTFDDMLKTQVTMGATSVNNNTGYLPIMLDNVLGAQFKVVFGYNGTSEIALAMQKREVDGMCGVTWTTLTAQYKDVLENGQVKIVVQVSDRGLAELNKIGVPLTVSYAHDERQRHILEIIDSQEVFGRPYFVAADVPTDRLQVLRRAFMETWRDPNLLEEAAKMHLEVEPMSGEQIQSLLWKIYASPPALLRSVKEAVKPRTRDSSSSNK